MGAHKIFVVSLTIGTLAAAFDANAFPEPDDLAGPPPFSINGCPANAPWTVELLARHFGVSERAIRRARSKYGMDALALCTAPWESTEFALTQASMPKPGFDRPDLALEFRALSLKSDDGTIAADGVQKSYAQRQNLLAEARKKRGGLSPGAPFWTEIGPGNAGGRVRAVLPLSTTRILVGSVSGGLWLTENGGTSWTAVRDMMPNVAISCLVPDPADPSIVYICTGEGFGNFDAVPGDGIYRITGANGAPSTWVITQVAGTAAAAGSQWRYVYRLVVRPNPGDPANVDNRYITASNGGGIYRSTNGGTSFALVTFGGYVDIKSHPLSPDNFVAGNNRGGVAYSLDAGATWNAVATTGLPVASGDRVEVFPVPGVTSTWLASVNADQGQLWRSVDGGVNWTRRDVSGLSLSTTPSGGVLGMQGWYDNVLWSSPDGSRVMVGGVSIRLSLDGGVTFGVRSCAPPNCPLYNAGLPYIHVDHHAIVPSTDYLTSGIVYFGQDGGVSKANIGAQATNLPAGSIFTSLNNGLGITQFYGGAGAGSGSTLRVTGGSQDNGSWIWNGASWSMFDGGDGGEGAVDPSNTQYVYGEFQNGVVYRSSIGGVWAPPYPATICQGILDVSCSNSVTIGKVNFIAPYILDPNNSDRMLFGGESLWRTNNVRTSYPGQPAWTAIKGPQIDRYCISYPTSTYCNDPAGIFSTLVSFIAVAPGNPDIVWVGYNDGQLFATTNGTAATPAWTNYSSYPGLASAPTRMVTRILVDPSNSQRVWVGLGGYNTGNVVRTTNGGAAWADVHGNLPASPVRALVRHPVLVDTVYAGTEVGVFATDTAGTTWSAANEGPGTVSVEELFFTDSSTLYASTHGRGMFRANVDTGADLSLTQTINANPATAGKDAVFTMTVTNNGPAVATGVSVGASYDSAATVIWASPGCVKQGSLAYHLCTVGTLANGASAQFKLVLRESAAGSVYNNASVSSTTSDPNSANNTANLTVTVNAATAGIQVLRYRLYSPVTLEHHFTTDLNEYNVLGGYVGTWVQEGTVGKVLNNPGSFGGVTATPYYRLYDTSTRWHHWTTDANEYYTLITFPWWTGEGVDGYILPTTTTGATQLYRLLYPFIPGLHHWTIDPTEYGILISTYGWIGEGGSGFVIQ